MPGVRRGGEDGMTGAQKRPRWRRMLTGLVIVGALVPVRVTCGQLRSSCAAPGPAGAVIYYYEVEPLGVTMVETLFGFNTRLYYYSGRSRTPAP